MLPSAASFANVESCTTVIDTVNTLRKRRNFEVDTKVVGLVVPFLSLFPALKLARVGGFTGRGSDESRNEFLIYREVLYGTRNGGSKEDDIAMLALRMSICGAYRFGSIPSRASIRVGYGHCPCRPDNFNRDENPYCRLCAECIETFPMKDALSLHAYLFVPVREDEAQNCIKASWRKGIRHRPK